MITNIRIVDERDLPSWCWRELRFWQHIDTTKNKLITKYSLPKNHHANAQKQAKQIRSCIQQADEYYKSAMSASMSIKPVLLYYCCMSLALAEILWKGTGSASLDALRADHRHHGLSFVISQGLAIRPLEEAIAAIGARPSLLGSKRTGTFEIWHRLARHLPMVGEFESIREHGIKSTGYEAILHEADVRMPLLAAEGIKFFDAIKYIPEMQAVLLRYGVETGACRAWISRRYAAESARINHENNYRTNINIQPGNKAHIEKVLERVKCSPSAINAINLIELGDSAQIIEDCKVRDGLRYWVDYPSGINRTPKEAYLFSDNTCLNEFGMFYVGLFILGNLCRYYPDTWMRILEEDNPFATISSALMDAAFQRIPVLCLSVLGEEYILEKK
jgi:hypothetical protein